MTPRENDSSMESPVLIIGGGIGGLQTALCLDELGIGSVVLEASEEPGGLLGRLDKLFPSNDCSDCVLSGRLSEAAFRPGIRIFTEAVLEAFSGEAGRFSATFTGTDLGGRRRQETMEFRAAVLALGASPFDPALKPEFGSDRFPNVVTALEFEEWIRPGPSPAPGLRRPSDGTVPQRIAFLQCIGSRDKQCGHEYCSSVCCAYAVKEAEAAHEQVPDLKTSIFFMDIRALGKDLDEYMERARERHGIAFVYGRVPVLEENPETRNILITYETEDGTLHREEFDLAVLSVGLTPPPEAERTAELLGIELNAHGFCRTSGLKPVETSRPGIYVCGCFQDPKDVAGTLDQAAAAAALCAPENLLDEEPAAAPVPAPGPRSRIGVFTCGCGGTIGKKIDVAELATAAASKAGVAVAEYFEYACSDESLRRIEALVHSEKLDGVVVAACSPRILEPLFQQVCTGAGIPPGGFEMANIREQCAWVHEDPRLLQEKARLLLDSAVTRVAAESGPPPVPLSLVPRALVVGGGVSGMATALHLCHMGLDTTLVERSPILGGQARHLRSTWDGEAVPPYLEALIREVEAEPRLSVLLDTTVVDLAGSPGRFVSSLRTREGNSFDLEHGVLVLATGALEAPPHAYGYGSHPSIVTLLELDAELRNSPENLERLQCAVFILCAGSREPDRPYCSRVCCTHSLKSALALKELRPDLSVFMLYRDIRTYGFRETLYGEAREQGVLFVRYRPERKPEVRIEEGGVRVRVYDELVDLELELAPDRLVLAAGMEPVDALPGRLLPGMERDEYGFLREARMPICSVETGVEGVFVAGLAQAPKSLDEALVQAHAAAARAAAWVRRAKRARVTAVVDPSLCSSCLACVRACPYGAPSIREHRTSRIDPALCRGCGICVGECPAGAISLTQCSNVQILRQVGALLGGNPAAAGGGNAVRISRAG